MKKKWLGSYGHVGCPKRLRTYPNQLIWIFYIHLELQKSLQLRLSSEIAHFEVNSASKPESEPKSTFDLEISDTPDWIFIQHYPLLPYHSVAVIPYW